MYCKYCGKPSDDPEHICPDCRMVFGLSDGRYKSTYGLAGSIVSVAAGLFGMTLLSGWVFITFIVLLANRLMGERTPMQILAIVMIMLICTALVVSSFILGVISIRKHAKAQRHGARPTATLVMGIIGVVLSGSGIVTDVCMAIIYVSVLLGV